MKVHQVKICTLPTQTVIIYSDRAEVKRGIRINLSAGKNLIQIENVSTMIDEQSQAAVTILEVGLEEVPNGSMGEFTQKLADLEKTKIDLETQNISLADQIDVLMKRSEIVDGAAKQVSQNMSILNNINIMNNSCTTLEDEIKVNDFASFLEYYDTQANKIRAQLRNKEKQKISVVSRLCLIENEIDRYKLEDNCYKRRIKLLAEAKKSGPAEFQIVYQALCVSWKPCYSLRASSSGLDINCGDIVHLSYDALVEQKTGEDWEDAEIILTTAQPLFTAGKISSLPTLIASIKQDLTPSLPQRSHSIQQNAGSNESHQEEDAGIGSQEQSLSSYDSTDTSTVQSYDSDNELTYPNECSLPPLHFPIELPATIKGRGEPQKVQIANIDLSPVFVHEFTPSRQAALASVTALLKNTSTFPFLPGPMSIFLNNNFVRKTHMKLVRQNQDFSCLLGVDNAIKIEYKDMNKVDEQIGFGFITKNVQRSTKEQVISLRNAKVGKNVTITIKEAIPKSTDEKIKVTFIQPEIKTRSNRAEATVNKDNILEWKISLEPGQQRDITLKWSMEHSRNEDVVVTLATPSSTPSSTLAF